MNITEVLVVIVVCNVGFALGCWWAGSQQRGN